MKKEIIRLKNQLMDSNCFIIVDIDYKSCIIIDPASEEAEKEIKIIEEKGLYFDYIILTHAHADHCWGVNALRKKYPDVKLVYSKACCKNMQKALMLFFRMWHEDVNYRYEIKPAEIQIEKNTNMEWHGHSIHYILTPGHSLGSMCIDVDGELFTGDTMMPFPPYFNGRGSDKADWRESVKGIRDNYASETIIYPGHGDILTLGEWINNEEYSKCK